MKKTLIVAVLLVSFVVSPVYAASKIGFGIDFLKSEEEYESTNDYRVDFEDTDIGLRLYYEYLLKELLGIQLEFGFYKYESSDKATDNIYDTDSQDYSYYDYYKMDLSGLFKYYFYIKNDISLYLAGGLGLEYKAYKTTHEDYDGYGPVYRSQIKRKTLSLIEQVSIGIQFPLFKRFSIFIEDRFRNKISDGQLRVGFYLLPSKKKVNRRRK